MRTGHPAVRPADGAAYPLDEGTRMETAGTGVPPTPAARERRGWAPNRLLPYAGRTLAATIAAALLAASVARAQSGRLWRPDERILITNFHELGAVTSDLRRVYAASPGGIEIYDFAARRWEPPITLEDGFPPGERPTALLYDRFLDALWMGTEVGNLYVYRIHSGQWEAAGPVPGGTVLRIVSDPSTGEVFVATRAGWMRLGRGSLFPEPVPPNAVPDPSGDLSPEAKLRRLDPFFEAIRGTLTLDERLRRWPITDVEPADQPARFWVATRGGNLLYYDSRRMSVDRLSYGVLTRGVGALASDGGQIWFGGDGRGARRGVTVASAGLQRWKHYESQYDGAPAGRVWDILPATAAVWFAASDGLYRLDRAADTWQQLTEREGLPAREVLALAPGPGGVWVGTRNGLTFVTDDGEVERAPLLPARRILALLSSRDTLWIATERGLWILPDASAAREPDAGGRGAIAPVPAPGVQGHPGLRGEVRDVQPLGEAVFVITADALHRLDGTGWSGPLRDGVDGLGQLHALAAADGQLWVGGDAGAARYDVETRIWTRYLQPADIPEGPVRDVLPAGDDVWLATPAGALRLRWRF